MRNIFIIDAVIADANGTFNHLQDYPKTFDSNSYGGDIAKARKRAEERTFIVGRYGRQRDEISDKTVSRQHCRVSLLDDGMVEIENLSQSNGTVINGEKIDKIRTSMDADLKMGNYIVKVRDLFPPRKNPTGPDKQTTA